VIDLTLDRMRDFRARGAGRLYDLLISRQVMWEHDADKTVYALSDITESIEKVYGELIPKLLAKENPSQEQIQELLWDIREEFRHIDYHIRDGELT
jgi:hypothetical protein